MASIALMIGGAVANALAFSGSNYLFSQLGRSDVDTERKRHDKAIGDLQAAQVAWNTKRTERLDFLRSELRRQGIALQSFADVDEAMRTYNMVTGETLAPLEAQPSLPDFYVPSEAQRDREIAFILLVMGVTGLAAYKIAF